jgi:hypothetical protein
VAIWTAPPDGRQPDVLLRGEIGGVALGELRGVAFDGTNFFLASYDQHRVWAWRGLPTGDTRPFAEIEVQQPGRLSSDGRYLAVTTGVPGGGVFLYEIERLGTAASTRIPVGQGLRMNLPQGVTLASGGLFVADTNANRVLAWRDVADAAAGRPPTAVLGASDLDPRRPAIGTDTLFWPGAVAHDGTRLWVGEFKFSNRVLRFTIPAETQDR